MADGGRCGPDAGLTQTALVRRPPCSSCGWRCCVKGRVGAKEKLGTGSVQVSRLEEQEERNWQLSTPPIAPNARGSRPAATSNTAWHVTAQLPLLLHAWIRLSAFLNGLFQNKTNSSQKT
ncbi:hypothetical protein NDU88_009992 [Pleurodeles waltl]|uniref:Uncharacterized protein n=1 Tax=Pleurodeles waltl TaxID=8319 RepID=A0AAV7QW83_PLEWA|nr:hypothetical protein NDU88_009992 [Pleurodeles waltl]